ncbi:MAG: hypothetical protein FD180_3880 [Planctomycetota bacterium]|nr:MAG: hypothetical protein FD180_3880 [Planctomycetota bacterium]
MTSPNATDKVEAASNEFGLSLWAKDNEKPGLIYFYWSDSSDPRGKKSQAWTRDFFDTEDVARASKHFLCYKVDASKQDAGLLKKRGLDPAKMPAIVVTSPTGKFVCILPEVKSNVALKDALENALAQHFPALWKSYDRVYLELEKLLDVAREDYKKNNFEAALEKLAKIIEHPVRTSLIERAEELQEVVQTKLDNLERKQK